MVDGREVSILSNEECDIYTNIINEPDISDVLTYNEEVQTTDNTAYVDRMGSLLQQRKRHSSEGEKKALQTGTPQ